MALRTIRTEGDSVLEKICRPVEKIDKRTKDLVGDMLETMYDACGVGLAAPQVGILKRIVVIDIGDGPIILINPEILMTSGELRLQFLDKLVFLFQFFLYLLGQEQKFFQLFGVL